MATLGREARCGNAILYVTARQNGTKSDITEHCGKMDQIATGHNGTGRQNGAEFHITEHCGRAYPFPTEHHTEAELSPTVQYEAAGQFDVK